MISHFTSLFNFADLRVTSTQRIIQHALKDITLSLSTTHLPTHYTSHHFHPNFKILRVLSMLISTFFMEINFAQPRVSASLSIFPFIFFIFPFPYPPSFILSSFPSLLYFLRTFLLSFPFFVLPSPHPFFFIS